MIVASTPMVNWVFIFGILWGLYSCAVLVQISTLGDKKMYIWRLFYLWNFLSTLCKYIAKQRGRERKMLLSNFRWHDDKKPVQFSWLSPNWHELWKQEKCLSLAPPLLKDTMSLVGHQINPIDVNFHFKKVFDKNSAAKIWSKQNKGLESTLPHAN